MEPARRKKYKNDEITVFWDAKVCIHSGICLRGLPQVFDLKQRPWIQVDAGDNEKIMQVINRCPSGALDYETRDGKQSKHAEKPENPMFRFWRNGPIEIEGPVKVQVKGEEPIAHNHRITLCRCGASGNKPYCDGSHHKVKFKD